MDFKIILVFFPLPFLEGLMQPDATKTRVDTCEIGEQEGLRGGRGVLG